MCDATPVGHHESGLIGFPIVCVLLDGLGDWPSPALGGRTPLEAAATPHLDDLARAGASALLYPLGPGRAPSSERAQWEYLGYTPDNFPGRAALEAEGSGVAVPPGGVTTYVALRSARRDGGRLRLQNWYREAEDDDCRVLLDAVGTPTFSGITFRLRCLGRGDAVAFLDGATSADVTDSDPFSTSHAVLAVEAQAEARNLGEAQRTASALNAYLRHAHAVLDAHPVNDRRRDHDALPLNVVVTKWGGRRHSLPPLEAHVGGRTAFVASRELYAGFAKVIGADFEHVPEGGSPAAELHAKVARAQALVADGYALCYVHTKAADEAGHRKDALHKQAVIAALDEGLAAISSLSLEAIVAVTADHATPSWGPALHSGDAVPLSVAGPSVAVDSVTSYGERAAARGGLGVLRGSDLLAVLVNLAGRARFLGSRHGEFATLAAPLDPHVLDVSAADGAVPR